MGNDRSLISEFEALVLMAVMHLDGDDEAYGVPIRQLVEERTGRFVSVGALYTTLDRLANKGFVTSRLGEATAERGGRAKKYFKVEGVGVRALEDFDRAYSRMRDGLVLRPEGSLA